MVSMICSSLFSQCFIQAPRRMRQHSAKESDIGESCLIFRYVLAGLLVKFFAAAASLFLLSWECVSMAILLPDRCGSFVPKSRPSVPRGFVQAGGLKSSEFVGGSGYFFFWAKCAAEWSPALDRLAIVTVAILAQGKQSG